MEDKRLQWRFLRGVSFIQLITVDLRAGDPSAHRLGIGALNTIGGDGLNAIKGIGYGLNARREKYEVEEDESHFR